MYTKILTTSLVISVLLFLMLPLTATIFFYEQYFGSRVESRTAVLNLPNKDLPNLKQEPIEFTSNKKQILRGFIYSDKTKEKPLGLITVSHGLGGGYQDYLEVIAAFTAEGFLVLAYNNTGCFSSEGKSLYGLPQANIDLQAAIKFVESNPQLNELPHFIYGHSWGGYAACAVLNHEAKIKGVASLAGFNRASDILVEHAKKLYGNWVRLFKPHLRLYEFIKFGPVAEQTALKGIENFQGQVLLIHGAIDEVISVENSIISRLDSSSLSKVATLILPESNHDLVFSVSAFQYIEEKNSELKQLLKTYGDMNRLPTIVKSDFYNSIDKTKARELDQQLMTQVIDFFLDITKSETTNL